MVLGLVAVALGAAYLTSMPRSSAQELLETATEEAQGLVEFLVSRFSGRSLPVHVGARRVDPATKRMSRVLLLVAGVGVVVVGQKLYNRFVRASRIAGATVVVTGASQGIGAAVAKALAAKGAKQVVLVARSHDKLEQVCNGINMCYPENRPALYRKVDVSNPAQVAAFTETLTSVPDIVINCAGAGTWRFLAESSMNDLKLNLAAPFWAATWMTRALLPGMVARGSGSIVNVQSPAAYCAVGGATGYVAGRWALRGLSEATRADAAGTGVIVQEAVLSLTESSYFANNPGSLDRVPTISKHLGVLSVDRAAQGIIETIESGEDTYVYGLRMRAAMVLFDWCPSLVTLLVRSTGWTLAQHAGDFEPVRP